jgi:HD-GYP domain-containing protein (c-di-GMP phosphodiesterase class II)
MKTHALIGESVLDVLELERDGASDVIAKAIKIAGGHHEKWDGTGYPRGLAGHAIPLEARIMSLADMYDALLSERPYKKAWSHDEAVVEIISKRNLQFDPLIVDAFVYEQDAFNVIAQKYRDS